MVHPCMQLFAVAPGAKFCGHMRRTAQQKACVEDLYTPCNAPTAQWLCLPRHSGGRSVFIYFKRYDVERFAECQQASPAKPHSKGRCNKFKPHSDCRGTTSP